jgi:Rrf2 family protein
MSVIFSRQCEYALQAVLYIARKPSGSMTTAKELTKKLRIPYHFIGKILQSLARKGLLLSHRGPKGGFGLAHPVGEITLYHVVDAIDGSSFTERCVLGFPECSGKNPCPLHNTWGDLRESIYRMLVTKSIGQLAAEIKKPEYRTT